MNAPSEGWATNRLPALVGARDVCALLDIDKTTLRRRMKASRRIIPPAEGSPSSGPVWARADILALLDNPSMTEGPATNELPSLVGAKEACEILGVHKTTLFRRLAEGDYLSPSSNSPTSGPVWARSDIESIAAARRELVA